MKNATFLVGLALLTIPLFSEAQPAEPGADIDVALTACTEKADATLDIVGCYQQATAAWDRELNRQYRLLIAGQNAQAGAKLRDAQRAWLSYQQKYYAGIEAFYRQQQGSVWQIVAAQTKMNVIRDKARDLNRLNQSTNLSGESR